MFRPARWASAIHAAHLAIVAALEGAGVGPGVGLDADQGDVADAGHRHPERHELGDLD